MLRERWNELWEYVSDRIDSVQMAIRSGSVVAWRAIFTSALRIFSSPFLWLWRLLAWWGSWVGGCSFKTTRARWFVLILWGILLPCIAVYGEQLFLTALRPTSYTAMFDAVSIIYFTQICILVAWIRNESFREDIARKIEPTNPDTLAELRLAALFTTVTMVVWVLPVWLYFAYEATSDAAPHSASQFNGAGFWAHTWIISSLKLLFSAVLPIGGVENWSIWSIAGTNPRLPAIAIVPSVLYATLLVAAISLGINVWRLGNQARLIFSHDPELALLLGKRGVKEIKRALISNRDAKSLPDETLKDLSSFKFLVRSARDALVYPWNFQGRRRVRRLRKAKLQATRAVNALVVLRAPIQSSIRYYLYNATTWADSHLDQDEPGASDRFQIAIIHLMEKMGLDDDLAIQTLRNVYRWTSPERRSVRIAAVEALRRIPSTKALDTLRSLLPKEGDERLEYLSGTDLIVAAYLVQERRFAKVALFQAALNPDVGKIRTEVIEAMHRSIGQITPQQAVDMLSVMARNQSDELRVDAVDNLVFIAQRNESEPIRQSIESLFHELLEERDAMHSVRSAVIAALGELCMCPDVLLRLLLNEQDAADACKALKEMFSYDFEQTSDEHSIAGVSEEILGKIISELIRLLRSENPPIRECAADALSAIGTADTAMILWEEIKQTKKDVDDDGRPRLPDLIDCLSECLSVLNRRRKLGALDLPLTVRDTISRFALTFISLKHSDQAIGLIGQSGPTVYASHLAAYVKASKYEASNLARAIVSLLKINLGDWDEEAMLLSLSDAIRAIDAHKKYSWVEREQIAKALSTVAKRVNPAPLIKSSVFVVLSKWASDNDYDVRRESAIALSVLGNRDVAAILTERVELEQDGDALKAILDGVVNRGDSKCMPTLWARMLKDDTNDYFRSLLARAFRLLGGDWEPLSARLRAEWKTEEYRSRRAVLSTLRECATTHEVTEFLISLNSDEMEQDLFDRFAGTLAGLAESCDKQSILRQTFDSKARDTILQLLHSHTYCPELVDAVGSLHMIEAVETLITMLSSESESVTLSVVVALRKLASERWPRPLTDAQITKAVDNLTTLLERAQSSDELRLEISRAIREVIHLTNRPSSDNVGSYDVPRDETVASHLASKRERQRQHFIPFRLTDDYLESLRPSLTPNSAKRTDAKSV